MNEGILCLVALCFLGWVLVLKAKNADLNAQNHKLRSELNRFVKKSTSDADVTTDGRSWGKAEHEKPHPKQ